LLSTEQQTVFDALKTLQKPRHRRHQRP
jgi:hypothetical protein